jgi:hypothetical protein
MRRLRQVGKNNLPSKELKLPPASTAPLVKAYARAFGAGGTRKGHRPQ